MLTVKEPMLSPDGTSAEPDALAEPVAAELDELDEDDELQAAAVKTRPAARPATATRRKERELHAPVDLLPTLKPPYPFVRFDMPQ
jgi:hypothetical protein